MKKITLLCLSVGILFLLTACGIDLNTDFSADKDFKGTRIMHCSIQKTELSYWNQDFSVIDKLIKEYCPETMKFQDHSTKKTLSYDFILSFDSYEDYTEKIKTCLNFEPKIQYDYQTSPFANGLIYQENFTSRDLMAWLSEVLVKNEFMNQEEAENIWDIEDTLFHFDGSDYETDNQININTMKYLPLDSISFYTSMDEEMYEQTIVFSVPKTSLDLDSIGIEAYLMEKANSASFQWNWEGTKNGREYRVTYSADNLEELNQLSKKVLQATSSFTCKSALDKKVPFQINDDYTQSASFRAFRSSSDGKVNYKIYVKSSDGILKQTTSDADENGYYLLKEGNSDHFDFSFQLERPQTFSDFRVTTVFMSQNEMLRELLLTSVYPYSKNDIKLLSDRLKNIGFETVKMLSDHQLLLSVSGTPKEISTAYRDFLLMDNTLKAKTETSKVSRSQESIVQDQIDLSALTFRENTKGTYFFISNSMESIKNVSFFVDGKPETIQKLGALEKSSISDDSSLTHFKGEYKAVITNGSVLRLDYTGNITDTYQSLLIILIGLIFVLSILIILMYRRKFGLFEEKRGCCKSR